MTKIEEIARAIANAGGEYPDRIVGGKPLWVFHVSQARAAMEALREPSDKMKEAGGKMHTFGQQIYEHTAAACFNAMLDAALADSP
jgi:hypothetical protein